tara:strand:- start:31533 stop:32525 length:993 start_codon:yes stop_codon:yes gene_type:complete
MNDFEIRNISSNRITPNSRNPITIKVYTIKKDDSHTVDFFSLEFDIFNLDFDFTSSIKDKNNNDYYEKIKEDFNRLIIEIKSKKIYNESNFISFLDKEMDSLSLQKIESSFFDEYPILQPLLNTEFKNYFESFLESDTVFYLNIEKECLEYECFLNSQSLEYSLSDFSNHEKQLRLFSQSKKRLGKCKAMRVCSSSHFHEFPVHSFFSLDEDNKIKRTDSVNLFMEACFFVDNKLQEQTNISKRVLDIKSRFLKIIKKENDLYFRTFNVNKSLILLNYQDTESWAVDSSDFYIVATPFESVIDKGHYIFANQDYNLMPVLPEDFNVNDYV